MAEAIVVRPVGSQRELKQFIRLPWTLYGSDPYWVPPLLSAMRRLLDTEKNPFFEHAEATYYLAWQYGRPVGRIASIVNFLHNTYQGETTGFWGFFESERDPKIFRALFDRVADDLRERGMTEMRGPMNPSINGECGMLIEGFDLMPSMLMPYNPPYYPALLEELGQQKLIDLYAYFILTAKASDERENIQRLDRLAKAVRRRHPSLSVRTVDMANYEAEAAKLNDLFNAARRDNWGFVPVTDTEFAAIASDMKSVIDPHFIFIAEDDGQRVGCLMSIPDLNPILKKCNGRLLPFGWLRILLGKRKVRRCRVFGAAALPSHRNRGITALLFDHIVKEARRLGYEAAEMSWVAEGNRRSAGSLESAFDVEPYKRYRIYTSAL
ncbi:GNAT family N-acetyltransferase [bacterium]|nr:GNAT family N-acetyltransferase [bacterium]